MALERPRVPQEEGTVSKLHLGIVGAVVALQAIAAHASAQEARIAAQPLPPSQPTVYRLSLEQAQQLALTNNTGQALGRLGIQEKSLAVAAARKDYFPKLLGNVSYFHFNDNLGSVTTIRTGQRGILPVGSKLFAVNVANQDSALTAITIAQPITKLILVNAAVQLAKADTQIAKAQLARETRDLLSGVAQAYHGLFGAQRIQNALELQVTIAGQLAQSNPSPEIRVAMIETQQALLQVRSHAADITAAVEQPPRPSLLHDLRAGRTRCRPELPVHRVRTRRPAACALRCNPQVLEAQATVRESAGRASGGEGRFPAGRQRLRVLLQPDRDKRRPARDSQCVRAFGLVYVHRLGQAETHLRPARDAGSRRDARDGTSARRSTRSASIPRKPSTATCKPSSPSR